MLQKILSTLLLKRLVFCGLLFGLTACATLQPNFEKPTLQLSAIRMGKASGFEQHFILSVRIQNPNSVALSIKGMSYTVSLEGLDLASGVANNLPEVSAYGEASADIEVAVNLLNSLRFVQKIMRQPLNEVRYQLDAKLDIGHLLLPKLTISESGVIPLQQ